MRIGLIQCDPTVGDLAGNACAIRDAALAAHAQGASLCVASELAICGYPPRDLLGREGFVEACERAVAALAEDVSRPGLAVLVGSPRRARDGAMHNSVALLRDGTIEAWYDKRLLPTYDVFDERRHFQPGEGSLTFRHDGSRVGVLICEDLWRAEDVPGMAVQAGYQSDPVGEIAALGVDILCVPSASPFRLGKRERQHALLASAAERSGAMVVHANQAGANDDVLFEGESCIVAPGGTVVGEACAAFAPSARVVDTATKAVGAGDQGAIPWEQDLFRALCCAIEGYVRKTGHRHVMLGLSGGIDSAIVAALCVRAVGAGAVRGVMMPSKFSSDHSLSDARASAAALGMAEPDCVPITDAHATLSRVVGAAAPVEGLADENLQSRLRGLTLMTLSNATGALVVSTGNKSELATGYATLYGDMCGSIAPLGDVLKTQVYALARWMNAHWREAGFSAPPIPQGSLEKPPSAELRPDQTDQDSLPPYETLDRIVEGHVDREWSAERIAREHGLDAALVKRWCAAIDRNQFKRAQAPVVPKVSQRSFGPGRRMPLAAAASPGWTAGAP